MILMVCSYCKKEMGTKEGGDGVSHGICETCYPDVRASFGLPPKPFNKGVYNVSDSDGQQSDSRGD